MAQANDFADAIRPWLQRVWAARQHLLRPALSAMPTLQQRQTVEAIYAIYSREDIERDASPARMLRQITKLQRRAVKTIGAPLRVTLQNGSPFPVTDGSDWHNSFIVFDPLDYNDAEQYALADQTGCRLYVALLDPYWLTAPWLMEQMFLFKHNQPGKRVVPGVLRGKIAAPDMAAKRRDIGVIYFSNAAARMGLTQWLLDRDKSGLIGGPLPFGVERVAEGLGFADEPPRDLPRGHRVRQVTGDQLSFGNYLSAVIYLAMEDVGFGKCTREAEFLDRLKFRMNQIGIDPMRPQLLPSFRACNRDAYQPQPPRHPPPTDPT